MPASPILSLHDVTRRYGLREVVSGAGFTLQPGRIASLLGPSGCGKSTVLRMIAGLEPVDAGEIALGGEIASRPGLTVPPERRGVGLVFQDNALFPHLTVRDNVGFGVRDLPDASRRKLVDGLLARFHVGHLAEAWPHTLSGGEQQRVAIARALAREPVLLLLDEPFSGLDGHLRAQIRRSLIADLSAAGTTVLIVTHDPEEAMSCADDLILMAEGRILQTGEPGACFDNPVSLVAARLLGEALEVPVEVSSGLASTPFGLFPGGTVPDFEAAVIVRPGDLVVADTGLPARILAARRLGHETMLEVTTEFGDLAIHTCQQGLAAGQSIRLQLRDAAPRPIVRAGKGQA